MRRRPLLLVTCTRCQRLHPPLRDDAANPLCERCVLPSAGAARRRSGARTRTRSGAARPR